MATRFHPTPTDDYPTSTSKSQSETEQILLKHLPNLSTKPTLDFPSHKRYLARNLAQGLPSRYISQDASQPWLMFWTLQAFSLLKVGLDPGNRQRVIDKVMTWQHPDGGFGGGPGQAAHLLPTYAAVCSIAIVGRPGPKGGWDQIDRAKLYKFFMSLKQPDGSFLVAHYSEVDVRGIYCLLVVATLLDILTPELLEGTPAFVASCQTYEGGFASASHPYFTPNAANGQPQLLDNPRPPLGEAHGGYTFCAVASWVLLQPYLSWKSSSTISPSPAINLRTLLRWLVYMQGTEIELGGFKGRTNKLVDGCYSWWNGGAFALLEALGVGEAETKSNPAEKEHINHGEDADGDGSWVDDDDPSDDSILNRKALQEYILYACQHPAGGLRDKPPKHPDAYHTLYCIAGLSSVQHHVYPSEPRRKKVDKEWVSPPSSTTDKIHYEALRRSSYAAALSWIEAEDEAEQSAGGVPRRQKAYIVGGEANRVNATHPVFNLTMTHTAGIMRYFYGQNLER